MLHPRMSKNVRLPVLPFVSGEIGDAVALGRDALQGKPVNTFFGWDQALGHPAVNIASAVQPVCLLL
jgi:hypothetical protein